MPTTTDFLPFATGVSANVDAQGSYAGSTYQQHGFTTGTASSSKANKVWRQATMFAAAWANLVKDTINQNVPDDGNLTNLITQIQQALTALISAQYEPKVVPVAYSATPTFDCSAGNPLLPIFNLRLTGNVTSSRVINAVPGQVITLALVQDGTGGRTFVWPTTPAIYGAAPIDTTPNQVNLQSFLVGSIGDLNATGPLTLRI